MIHQSKPALSFRDIVARINEIKLPKTDIVLGIASGGITPAAMVAQRLGVDLKIINVNYRNPDNTPGHDNPVLLAPFDLDLPVNSKILLVDDVSVTGKTLKFVRDQLKGFTVTTFVMKGNADISVFPEIKDCVLWPWKIN